MIIYAKYGNFVMNMKLDDIKYHLILAAFYPFALLPFRMLYFISDVVFYFVYYIFRYRRKIVSKNLHNSFPEKSDKEIKKIEKRFYKHLCDCLVETVKLLHVSDKEIKKRIKLKNEHLVYEAVEQERPIILFLGHYGNWELVQAMIIMLDRPKVMGALYKRLHNKVLNRVVLHARSRFNLICIPTNTAYRDILRLKRDNPSFMIGFIADQRPLSGNLKHWTTFMGQPTAYTTGGEIIGSRVNANYLYVECQIVKRGHIVLNYKSMNPDPNDKDEFPYTRLYFRMLEDTIRANPAYWLWSHNRWKAKPPQEISDESESKNKQ